ncbi:MAG: PspA-associated protein PspAA [Mycobacteriales bacterium]
MIVRILGEGQLEIPEAGLAELETLDEELLRAVEADDEARFAAALAALLGHVRELGSPLPDEVLTPSDLVLPSPDAGLAEVRELLADEGLIPG